MKTLLSIIFTATFVLPLAFANESSIQFYIQPLKVKQQVGKAMMTEVGFYRFPVYMKHTHPAVMLNHICEVNRLEELSQVVDKSQLKNVNLANLYGLKVSYDLGKDLTIIDLTQVKKPARESYSEDDVIAMTLECVRLSKSNERITILTNEKTKKWKAQEPNFADSKKPFYRVKKVPLKLAKTELLYHLAHLPYELAEDYAEHSPHISFITYGGNPANHAGCNTSYNGIGLSKTLLVAGEKGAGFDVEMNPLVGYTFLKKANILTVKSPPKYSYLSWQDERKLAKKLMLQAAHCIHLTAKRKGESDKDFQLNIIDSRLSRNQCKAIEEQWKNGQLRQ